MANAQYSVKEDPCSEISQIINGYDSNFESLKMHYIKSEIEYNEQVKFYATEIMFPALSEIYVKASKRYNTLKAKAVLNYLEDKPYGNSIWQIAFQRLDLCLPYSWKKEENTEFDAFQDVRKSVKFMNNLGDTIFLIWWIRDDDEEYIELTCTYELD